MEESESEIYSLEVLNEDFVDSLLHELDSNPYSHRIVTLFKSKVLAQTPLFTPF